MSITGEFSKNSILNNLVIQRDDGYKGDNKPHYATSEWYKNKIANVFGSIDTETADAGDGAFYNTGTNYVSLSPFHKKSSEQLPKPRSSPPIPSHRSCTRVSRRTAARAANSTRLRQTRGISAIPRRRTRRWPGPAIWHSRRRCPTTGAATRCRSCRAPLKCRHGREETFYFTMFSRSRCSKKKKKAKAS